MQASVESFARTLSSDRATGLRRAAHRVGALVLFAVVPAALIGAVLASTIGRATFAYDFHGGLYDAARAILHGRSPYEPGVIAHAAAVRRAGGMPSYIDAPVYPPAVFLLLVPLALLPFKLAALLFAGLSIAALVLALRLLEVRDWRCYGIAFASWPVVSSIRLGALTPLLVLGAAIAWRWRDRVFVTSAAVASMIVAKLFPWTLAIWMLATRRIRAFAMTVVISMAAVLLAWAVIGFDGMAGYLRMLSELSFVQQDLGVSVVAGATSLGASETLATVATAALTVAALALACRLAGGEDGDRRAFGAAIVAALLGSTNVWPHYLALVFVPIALISPALSPLWFVPLLAYLAPTQQTGGNALAILPYFAIEVIVMLALCRVEVARALRPRGVSWLDAAR